MDSGMQVYYADVKKNKKLLFVLIGLASGLVGGLVSDIIYLLQDTGGSRPGIIVIISIAIWAGIFSAFIATGLYWAIEIYSRRKVQWPDLLKKSVPVGFVAGAISGGIAQIIYGPVVELLSDDFSRFLFQSACWGILGLILGWRFSKSIPNLDGRRALIAGAAGGFLGGAGFLIIGSLLIETPGRVLGVGIMGAALGLCLVIVEEISRSAFLEVHWNADEISLFSLGSTPVFIGSGNSDIVVPTVPNRAMSIGIEGGKIIATDHTKGKKKELVEGDHINIGKIDMIIRSSLGRMKVSSDR